MPGCSGNYSVRGWQLSPGKDALTKKLEKVIETQKKVLEKPRPGKEAEVEVQLGPAPRR